MAKFCTVCGKKLEDGKTCDCKKSASKKVEKETNGFDVKESFETIWETIKNMFKNPISGLKEYSKEKNMYSSIIIVAIVAILSGLMSLLLVNKLMSGLEFDKFEVFIKFFILSIIPVAANVLVYLFVYNVIFKSKVNWKTLLSSFAGTMILETIGLIVAFICTYINGYLAAIVMAFTVAIYLVQLITIIKHVTDIEEGKSAWAFAISFTLALVIVCLITNSITKDLVASLFTTSFMGGF